MKDYVNLIKNKEDNFISVCLYVQEDKLFAIGEKMNEINEEAYMNGYNWEAFFNYYLNKYYPEIIKGMESNPEAGAYFAEFEYSTENELKASKFIEIIEKLIENENNLYKILKDEGDEIEWD